MTLRRFRAPTGDGEVLAEPSVEALPSLVASNQQLLEHSAARVGGVSLREFRKQARSELQLPTDSPLIIGGHQPELAHPGVWVKNFAIHGLAKRTNGTSLNLIVDNDTLKTPCLRLPVWNTVMARDVRELCVPFDDDIGEVPYETRSIQNAERFAAFAEVVREATKNWPFEPMIRSVWQPTHGKVGETFSAWRQNLEQEWGCHNREVTVRELSQTASFARFVSHISTDLVRFRAAYNGAVIAYRRTHGLRSKNHPVPDLAEGELPFWEMSPNGRRPATSATPPRATRPRALTLTLFARLCLGDFFIHGIGGGKYDEVTDAIIRDYFRIEPPAYQVLSATLHLPFPHSPRPPNESARLERQLRDLHWNPQRYLPDAHPERDRVVAATPTDRAGRRHRYRDLREWNERLRPQVAAKIATIQAELEEAKNADRDAATLTRRDYAWVLYPEIALKPFLLQRL